MKVKIIRTYNDLVLKKSINAGETLEVADSRGKILIAAKVAESIAKEKSRESNENKEEVNTEAK